MRRFSAALAVLYACSVAPAVASTTLGSTSLSGSQTCAAGAVYYQEYQLPPNFIAPGAGVLTSYSVEGAGNAGKRVQLFVVHRSSSGAISDPWTIAAKAPVATLVGNPIETIPVRIAVRYQDEIALGTVDAVDSCIVAGTGPEQATVTPGGTSKSEGELLTPTTPSGTYRVNLSATFEGDADGDGYGDDTQDSCPADPALHSGLCAPDLALSAGASPASALAGGVAAVAFTVTNHGAVAHGVAVKPTLPAGLTLAGSFPACQDTCPIGDLASGETTTVTLLVSAAGPGTYSVSGVGSSSGSDNNSADNGATANVTFASALGKFPACMVPSLKGLPRAFAKRLLGAAGCKLGKVTRKKAKTGKRGSVIKQGTKAGTVLPLGATVQVTVRR